MNPQELQLNSVVYRQDLYPRIETSAVTVQKYAEDLDVLPPIEVNQHNELIDGWHRWTAHKKREAATIRAIVTATTSDAHLLELAIERNASHGLQLSQEDKRDMARKIYHAAAERDREDKKKQLAKILSVSERTIRDWLSRIDKDSKEARNRKIFDLWLSCHADSAIAKEVNLSREAVNDITGSFGESSETTSAAAKHEADFQIPLYNVWKKQEKTPGSSHFGNSEVQWVDNLLYLYTKAFDVVIDPFAGGGSTIDICKKRFRRYWVGDRKPVPERAAQIRQHDLISGLPRLHDVYWEKVRLVYLDPPYWKQAENQYSTDVNDLANMPLEQFTEQLANTINSFAGKLKSGAAIALIIQPTQWKAPERKYTDHIADMLAAVKLPVDMRISCPYESQQCNAQMVDWAKENKKLLVLSREIVVWRVA